MKVDYPAQIKELIASGAALAVDIESPPGANHCPNCRGLTFVYYFRIKGGAKSSPRARGDKWLEIDGRAGWYSGNIEGANCPACNSKGSSLQEWLISRSRLADKDLELTISSFKVTGALLPKAPARDAILNLLSIGRPGGFITLFGGNGTGKTHLVKAGVNGFRSIGIEAVYYTMADLLDDIRVKYGEPQGAREVKEAVTEIENIPVLGLDEIDPDRVNLTGWAKEVTFRILDIRYNSRESLTTILATNRSLGNMPPELNYLRSRMGGGLVIEVPPPDMRPVLSAAAQRIEELRDREWVR